MVCPACGATREADGEPEAEACPSCGADMVYADPAAAAVRIARAAAPPAAPPEAWPTILREVLIGLGWGVALSFLVVYPLRIQGTYRAADGRIVQNYLGAEALVIGEPPPPRFPLGWGEWAALLVRECGPVVAIPVMIGVAVGAWKVLTNRRARRRAGA